MKNSTYEWVDGVILEIEDFIKEYIDEIYEWELMWEEQACKIDGLWDE